MTSIRDHFDALCDLPRATQRERLAQLSLSPAERERLDAMLAASARTGSLLDHPIEAAIDALRDDDDALLRDLVGTKIGAFRLLELVGRGGSSAVFRAERPAGLGSQVVALKLLQTGLHSPDAQRRFLREQAILAQLEHPDVARLVEGGVSESGIPYIAIEFVAGQPITRAADDRRLDLEARLALFLRLCRAVQAAHAALVVHCDLKPSNVLVDARGALKVLDFGIGRLLGDEGEGATAIALTPGYAAPEQYARGAPTVAVDVHALGVVLGELVTGRRLRTGEKPSSILLDALAEPPPGLPPPRALARRLSGDFDAIVATATAPDPAARYASAEALARDVERFVEHRPIRARNAPRHERVAKFARRHRAAVLAFAGLSTALVATAAYAVLQTIAARREAEAAHAATRRADGFSELLFDAFAEARPAGEREGPATVVDAMERGLAAVAARTELEPRPRLELGTKLADVLRNQGETRRALDVLAGLRAEAERAFAPDDPLLVSIDYLRAKTHADHGDWGEARTLLDDLLARVPATDAYTRARVLTTSGWLATRIRDRERALGETGEALALARATGDAHAVEQAMRARGSALLAFAPGEEAIGIYRNLLARQRAQVGDVHQRVAAEYAALSRAYRLVGRVDEAEAAVREALAIDDKVYPGDHWHKATHLNALVMVHRYRRDFVAMRDAVREQVRIERATQKPDHPDLLAAANLAIVAAIGLEDFAEAERIGRDGLAAFERYGAERTAAALRVRGHLAYALARSGRLDEARATLDEALALVPEGDGAELALELHERGFRIALDAGANDASAEAATHLVAMERLAARSDATASMRASSAIARAELAMREHDPATAGAALARGRADLDVGPWGDRVPHAMAALLDASARRAQASPDADEARAAADAAYRSLANPPLHVRRHADALGLRKTT